MTSATLDRAAVEVVAGLGLLPEEFWDHQDDACDCTFQRIGMWTNPYIAETLEVRMCCIWKELYKLFPQFVRVTPAFLDYNRNEWSTGLREWDGETEMPRHLWHRQVARKDGITVAEARERCAGMAPPRGIPRPVPEPQPEPIDVAVIVEMIASLFAEVEELKRDRNE